MTRKTRIEETLTVALSPSRIEVTNESSRHNVPSGSESHFKVLVVSEGFTNQAPLARHRQINRLLTAEFAQGLHALAIHAWTPEEWSRKEAVPASPPCRGGSKATG